MSTKLSFREVLERQEQGPGGAPGRSDIPTVKVHLSQSAPLSRPVDLARLLTEHGLTLRKAHTVLDRLAEGRIVALELECADFADLSTRCGKLGIKARRLQLPEVELRRIRDRFQLTQAEFADRFHLGLDNVRNWEQGRFSPDPATRLLLKVIEMHPEVVESVLTETFDAHTRVAESLVAAALDEIIRSRPSADVGPKKGTPERLGNLLPEDDKSAASYERASPESSKVEGLSVLGAQDFGSSIAGWHNIDITLYQAKRHPIELPPLQGLHAQGQPFVSPYIDQIQKLKRQLAKDREEKRLLEIEVQYLRNLRIFDSGPERPPSMQLSVPYFGQP